MTVNEICPICCGTGYISVSQAHHPCWHCNGFGFIPKAKENEEDIIDGD